jgi:8-hydroxy-5-deazaflavin:NADPH oxidoreductase
VNIAIIGTGNVGRALATSSRRAGHTVTIAGRDAAKAATTATDLGVESTSTAREAASNAQLVILAVPSDALPEVAQELAQVVAGKTVVDATNRMQPDATTASNAETLQERLPSANVIKAFNTSFASRQADPQINGVRVDGYVAGDDAIAKQQVLDLAQQIGFSPVDAGPLASSRTLEGLAWINISRNLDGGSWQGGLVLLEPAA